MAPVRYDRDRKALSAATGSTATGYCAHWNPGGTEATALNGSGVMQARVSLADPAPSVGKGARAAGPSSLSGTAKDRADRSEAQLDIFVQSAIIAVV